MERRNEEINCSPTLHASEFFCPWEEMSMHSVRNVLLGVWLGSLLVFPVAAQTGQQPPAKDPLSTWLRNAYNGDKKNITRAADKMPEEFYTLRPGPQMDVRTFGQIVG